MADPNGTHPGYEHIVLPIATALREAEPAVAGMMLMFKDGHVEYIFEPGYDQSYVKEKFQEAADAF